MGSALGARLRDGGARVARRARRAERAHAAARGRGGPRGRRSAGGAPRRGRCRALGRPAGGSGRGREAIGRGSPRGDGRSSPTSMRSRRSRRARRRRARRRRAGASRRLDLRPASHGRGRRGSTSRGSRASEVAALPFDGVERVVVGDADRPRVGREDVHGVGLQGPGRAARAGAPDRAPLRGRRPRPRRSRGHRPREPRPGRRDARQGVREGLALRRRDGGDRRDAGRRRSHALPVPAPSPPCTRISPGARSPTRRKTVPNDVPLDRRARALSAEGEGRGAAEAP